MENITIENETENDILNKMVSCTLEEKVVDAAFKEETSIVPKKESVNIVVKKGIPAGRAKMYSKITKELNVFFSDRNVMCDKYLQKLLQVDDGWVRISLLSTFSTINRFSTKPKTIAAAVKNDTDCILEVDKANEKIRRKPDSPAPIIVNELMNELIKRSVFCEGFPKTATVRDLYEFAFGFGRENIAYIIERKAVQTGEFKGSLYLTFNSKEQAEHFLKLKSVKYNGVEIKRMWEIDFFEEKSKEYFEISRERKPKTETMLKKGYLIKVNILNETITHDRIKTVCNDFNWPVDFIEFFEDQKIAWIRLRPVIPAIDYLNIISHRKNDPNIVFSIPEEEIEQSVLEEMYKNMISNRKLRFQRRQQNMKKSKQRRQNKK